MENKFDGRVSSNPDSARRANKRFYDKQAERKRDNKRAPRNSYNKRERRSGERHFDLDSE